MAQHTCFCRQLMTAPHKVPWDRQTAWWGVPGVLSRVIPLPGWLLQWGWPEPVLPQQVVVYHVPTKALPVWHCYSCSCVQHMVLNQVAKLLLWLTLKLLLCDVACKRQAALMSVSVKSSRSVASTQLNKHSDTTGNFQPSCSSSLHSSQAAALQPIPHLSASTPQQQDKRQHRHNKSAQQIPPGNSRSVTHPERKEKAIRARRNKTGARSHCHLPCRRVFTHTWKCRRLGAWQT